MALLSLCYLSSHRSREAGKGKQRRKRTEGEHRAMHDNPVNIAKNTCFANDLKMVPATGLEPVRCYSLEPESSASANSATRAMRVSTKDSLKPATDTPSQPDLASRNSASISGRFHFGLASKTTYLQNRSPDQVERDENPHRHYSTRMHAGNAGSETGAPARCRGAPARWA